MKKNYISLLISIVSLLGLTNTYYSQSFSLNTATILNGGNGSGGISFNITANNSVFVKDIKNAFYGTSSTTVEVWYNTTPISGFPTISTATGWVSLGTVTLTPANTAFAGPHTLQSTVPLNLLIPAGSTYGFFISGTNCAYTTYSTQAPTYSDANITIDCGPGAGYGGPPPTPSNSTRMFNGEIGYDLASFSNDDAGIDEVFPTTVCAGSANIEAAVRNYGINQIDSVWVNWSINGVLQTPVHYKSLLDTFAGSNPYMDTVLLGSHTFIQNDKDTILVWTSLPNGVADTVNFNDTLEYIIEPAMNGSYTIGGITPDFPSFNAALTKLDDLGVCGPVVFNVRGGNYYEQLELTAIDGVSAINTILFRADTGVTVPVEIINNSTLSTANYVTQFNGASYITFDSIDMTATGASYARVISYTGSNNHITIKDGVLKGNQTITSTSNNYAVIYDATGATNKNSNITINNNKIIGGSYSIFMNGVSTTIFEDSLIITNNEITDNFYYSIYLNYQSNSLIEGNYIEQDNAATGASAGVYANYCDTGKILRNEIHLYGSGTNYGIYAYYCKGDTLNPFLIANNMITTSATSTGVQYGIGHYYSSYTNVYHNSINVLGTSPTNGVGMYIYGNASPGNRVINNIFANFGGGFAAKINANAISGNYIDKSDKNIFYTTGTDPFEVSGVPVSTLNTWTTNTALDTNSYITDPEYNSNHDLHTDNLIVNNNGDTTLGITIDIDGDVRPHPTSTKVDIGADEFLVVIANNNGGTENILPDVPCPGVQNVEAVVKNFGINQIDSVIVNWSVNGVLQPPFTYYGLLDTLGGTGQVEDTVAIGTYSFTAGVSDTVTIWTTMPNGVVDTNTYNDSTTKILTPALGGIYTIGGSAPDYLNFNDAVSDLNLLGVCGPVIFLVRDSIYGEQVQFGPINGVSAVNTITFMPDPANINPVELNFAPTSSTTNYIVEFNGASYIYFDSIVLTSSGTTYGRVINFDGNNDHIGFYNGEINGNTTSSSTSTNYTLINNISGTANLTSNITFDNNLMRGGSYTMYWYGGSTSTLEDSLVVTNNTITENYYYTLYLYYQNNSVIRNNYIEQRNTSTTSSSGIYANYADNISIESNEIQLYGTSTNYGMYLRYCDALPGTPSRVINNMVVTAPNGTSTTYGISPYYCNNMELYHNSVQALGSSPTNTRAVYMVGSASYSGVKLINNIFASPNGGLAAEVNSGGNSTFSGSDKNIYYSSSGNPFEVANSPVSSLANWITATSLDNNSLYGDPQFFGTRDLHINGILANDVGDNTLGINVDIDNDPRPFGTSTIVDIGADEFDPPFCPTPAGFTIYDIGADSLLVTWVGGPNDSVWQIEYGVNGFTPSTGTTVTVTSNPYIVTGLTPDTYYDFYIRTRCVTNDSSGWGGPYSDTTKELCAKAPFLTVLHEDSTFINVGWNIHPDHSSYLLEYGPVGFTPGTGTVIASASNFVQVTGLNPQTQYEFYVRAICTTGDTSVYEGPVVGTTKCSGLLSLPYFTNFDVLPSGPGSACLTTEYLTDCFINAPGNQAYWQPRIGSTPSSSTGPTGDRTSGSGTYVYLESSGCYNTLDTIITPYYRLDVPIPAIDFSYHMYGSAMGNLRVIAQTKAGNTFTQFVKIGDQGNLWHDETIILNNVKDSIARFLIIGQIGANITSDMAIDDWRVYDSSPASISEDNLNDQLIIFPNPNNGEFTIQNIGKQHVKGTIEIFDVNGRLVYAKNNVLGSGQERKINLTKVEKGVYTLIMNSAQGRVQKRVVIH